MTEDPSILLDKKSISHEKFVGMDCYSTDTPGTKGIIKADIADFIVREITPSKVTLSTWDNEDKKDLPFNSKLDKYTNFTLIKKKTDTIRAAQFLQKYLNVQFKDISWAGIKDNTAITAQLFSVRGNHFHKLSKLSHDNITLTGFYYTSKKTIDLGKLWGNHFTINVRQIKETYDTIQQDLIKWNDQINLHGFPNYFGIQRFGHHRPNSHIVGKMLFLGQFQEAVEEFLFHAYPLEYDSITQFRKELESSRDYRGALVTMPRALSYEAQVIYHMAQHPGDYKGAILSLPVTLLNLIMSSFQSYLFNKALSVRIKRGDPLAHPVDGDMISVLTEARGLPSLVRYKFGGWNDENILKAFEHQRATIISPILGHFTKLTKYPYFGPIYQEILDDLDFSIAKFRHTIPRLFRFEGTFRAISNKPTNLQISQATFIGKPQEFDPKSVRLDFSLPKGTYATSLLRELMKK